MDDLTIYHYRLKSPVELQYRGFAPMSKNDSAWLVGQTIVPRTKEQGYELAAWLLVKGVAAEVLFIDGDRTPIDIEEGQSVLLTWKPGIKPEIQFNAFKFEGYQLWAYPLAKDLLKLPS